MGCTQAQNVNRIQIAPLGQDAESMKQFYRMQQEQQDLIRQYEGEGSMQADGMQGMTSAGGLIMKNGEKLVRQDWARLKQTLAPKNSIQLINCFEMMEPLLAKAVADDQELKTRVLKMFQQQTKTPKAHIFSKSQQANNSSNNFSAAAEDSMQSNGSGGGYNDEVEFCQKLAKEQMHLFRRKSRIADLCLQLANKFNELLSINSQLRHTHRASHQKDQSGQSLPWNKDWYNRFSLVLMQELASFTRIFKLIKSKGDTMVEQLQKSSDAVTYYACAMIVIRFLEGASWGYSEMLMHQTLDKDTMIALRVTYNLLLRLKQTYREDKVIGPAIQKEEDVPAIYCPEPVFQKIYSHNQLDKIICMKSRQDLESVGELQNDQSNFQFLENQIYRKTYVAAKKEIDEWLRSYSYQKAGKNSHDETSNQQKHAATAIDKDENEFLTQLQRAANQSTPGHQDTNLNSSQLQGERGNTASRELSFNSDVISMTQYRHQHSVKTLTREFLKKLKNPDLNLDGTLKPASTRKQTHHQRNLTSLHYDQNDPFAVAKAQITSSNEPAQKALTSSAVDGKPNFEIDNTKNVMLLVGAATDTRVVIESFLQANVRTRSKYKCCVLHCCARENKITHDSYYIVKNIIQQIVRTVPAVKNLLLLQNYDYFNEILSSKASLNKQLKLQQEAPAILVKFCKILQQIKLDFNICVFITGIENVFQMSDLQNIVYVIRSLTCNSLYMPPFLKFVLTAEKRDSKSAQFDLLVKLLQTKKIYELFDSSFYENESFSLLDFVYTYTEQQRLLSARRSSVSNAINNDENNNLVSAVAEGDQHWQQPVSSKADKEKLIKLLLSKSVNSYRIIVDILVKINQAQVDLTIFKDAGAVVQNYQSDHIRFLPKIQSGAEVQDPYDRMLTRTILQALTQICGPISFNLFAKICHCLMLTKQFVKNNRPSVSTQPDLPMNSGGIDLNNEEEKTPENQKQQQQQKQIMNQQASKTDGISRAKQLIQGLGLQEQNKTSTEEESHQQQQQLADSVGNIEVPSGVRTAVAKTPQANTVKDQSSLDSAVGQLQQTGQQLQGQKTQNFIAIKGPDLLLAEGQGETSDKHDMAAEEVKGLNNRNSGSPKVADGKGIEQAHGEEEEKKNSPIRISPMKTLNNNEDETQMGTTDAEFPKDTEDQQDGEDGELSSMTRKKNKDKKKTDIESVIQHVMSLLTLDQGVPIDFRQRLMEKLILISDFLHLVVKDKISTNRQVGSDDDSQNSSSNEQGENAAAADGKNQQRDSSNITELMALVNSLQSQGDHLVAHELADEIQSKLLIVPRKRKMLKACMAVLRVTKSRYFDAICQVIAMHEFSGENSLTRDMDLPWMPPVPYETIDPYIRLYIYYHWSKSEAKQTFTSFDSLLTAENIFKQIVYFGSYGRLRQNLRLILERTNCEEKESRGVIYLMNTLHLVQQTLKYEPINYLDFCTQFRGRVLGDAGARNLPDLKFDELIRLSGNTDVCYFENFHHALRENPRIDLIVSFPGCQILTLKFFADKKRVMLSLSNGLLILFNTETNQVLKVYVQSHAVIDKIKIIDDRYIICAGIDSKHRIWNIENQKQVSKFEMHGYCTSQMVIYKEFLITYGYSRTLVKFNFMKKKYDCWQETSSFLTNLKLLKTNDKTQPVKLIASFSDGDIVLYSVDLNVLCHINRTMQESALRIICLSLSECLFFQKDGQINVLSGSILEETKAGSIFSLKSDDYIDMILIKSREYFLFTIEKQKIEFFNATTFKRSDSWDYFFERDIVGCDKNKEGSKICVWDKGGYLTLFNFLKHLDNSQKQFNTPSHRRYDPVVCIDVTERLGEKNQVISCSLERDLRVWSRDTGLFLKKYDLSSFTAENVSTIKLGKSEGMLFLGSKDMNVYLIDVARGKLCVVYEGHWSRVTSIYTLPGKDILVTLSESNIKVWDLEYDECIKNMNDHSSLIVYCAQSHKDDQLIVTISQSLEYKEWNYVTGDIVKQYMIDLGGISDDQDNTAGENSSQSDDASRSSSGEDSSDDAMNPQGDESVGAGQGATAAASQSAGTGSRGTGGRAGRAKATTAQPENKPKNLVACHVSNQGFAYLAIDNNKIIVYNLVTKEVQSIFESYQCQTVIYLLSIETEKADYLIVVTRTSCVLYSLHIDGVRRMTSYLINSRKKPYRMVEENRFSYQVRFYFTSAKVVKAVEDDLPVGSEQGSIGPNRRPGYLTGGVGLLGSDFNMNQVNYDDAISQAQDYLNHGLKTPEIMVHDDMSHVGDSISMRQSLGGATSVQMLAQNHAETYKNAIESLSQSPLPAHNALAVSLQRSQHNGTISQTNLGNNQQFQTIPRQVDNTYLTENDPANEMLMQKEIMTQTQSLGNLQGMQNTSSTIGKRQKYLVYLGDSRGQVHMISLYLS